MQKGKDKIFTKSFSACPKKVVGSLIADDQTAHVPARHTGESLRLISDLLEYADSYDVQGFMTTADIEKAFYSITYTFISATTEKFSILETELLLTQVRINENISSVMIFNCQPLQMMQTPLQHKLQRTLHCSTLAQVTQRQKLCRID